MNIKHGSLYLADLSPRAGTESGKTRPVLVIQSDLLNEVGHPSTWIIPCTTNCTGENLLRVELPKGISGNADHCELMLDQSRAIDNRRFVTRLGKIPPLILREVKRKLRLIGSLDASPRAYRAA